MRKKLLIGLAVLAALLLVATLFVWFKIKAPLDIASGVTRFTLSDVTVINPGLERRSGHSVMVAGGRIEAVEPDGASPPRGEQLERYAGAFVLPGLIDLHSHLPPATPFQLTNYAALLYLRFGVTTVRDAGDADGTAVPAARDGLADGDYPGPRIFACGPFIGGGPPRWANTVLLEGAGEAAGVVDRLHDEGYQCVKAYEDLTVEEIRALVAAAAKHDMPVLGHVPYGLAYEEALIPDVAHFLGVTPPDAFTRDHIADRTADWRQVDDARLDRIVEVSLEHGIANTPTLASHEQLLLHTDYERGLRDPMVRLMPRMFRAVAWHPTEGLPFFTGLDPEMVRDSLVKKKELARRLYAAGATLRLGTDVPQPFVVFGASLQHEMRVFAEIGVPVEEIWEMATRRAGAELRQPGLGTVSQGAPADLLIFRRDPTLDLAALDSLEAVVAGGELLTRDYLDECQVAYQGHLDDPVFDSLSVNVARAVLDYTVKRTY